MSTQPLTSNLTSSVANDTGSTTQSLLAAEYLLWISNERQYELNRPTLIIYIVSIILGLTGNSLVVYVFGFRFEKSTANFFVTSLAVFDILTCFLLVFETLDLRFPMYSGNYPAICKTVRFFEVFCTSCSSILLVCIAFDRYYKICKPFKHISIRKVKKKLALTVCFTLVLSWPIALFHGTETIVMSNAVITGKDCADDDNLKGSLYSALYFFLLLVITVCFILAVIVLYCRVYWAIIKWKFSTVGESHDSGIWTTNRSSTISSREPQDTVPRKSTSAQRPQSRFVVLGDKTKPSESPRESLPVSESLDTISITDIAKRQATEESYQSSETGLNKNNSVEGTNSHSSPSNSSKVVRYTVTVRAETKKSAQPLTGTITRPAAAGSEEESVAVVQRSSVDRKSNKKRRETVLTSSRKKNVRTSRTTIMFSLAAIMYVISYIPTLVVESINAVKPFNLKEMSTTLRQMIVVANSAYFFNLSFNPIIYGVFNKHFRDEVVLLFKGQSKNHYNK